LALRVLEEVREEILPEILAQLRGRKQADIWNGAEPPERSRRPPRHGARSTRELSQLPNVFQQVGELVRREHVRSAVEAGLVVPGEYLFEGRGAAVVEVGRAVVHADEVRHVELEAVRRRADPLFLAG